MTCTNRHNGNTTYRCWRSDCPGCRKTYSVVAAQIVDDILRSHDDLRVVWWLGVEKANHAELTTRTRRLWDLLSYHDREPDKYLWFLTETDDQVARVVVCDYAVDTGFLNRYWAERYGSPTPRVLQLDQVAIRRLVAAHCGKLSVDTGRRMGSSESLPGVSPRRNSSGKTTPSHSDAYAGHPRGDDV